MKKKFLMLFAAFAMFLSIFPVYSESASAACDDPDFTWTITIERFGTSRCFDVPSGYDLHLVVSSIRDSDGNLLLPPNATGSVQVSLYKGTDINFATRIGTFNADVGFSTARDFNNLSAGSYIFEVDNNTSVSVVQVNGNVS